MSAYPEELQPVVKWLYSQPKSVKTRDDEELVVKTSCAQVRATRPLLKTMPLVVLSSGKKIASPLMAYQQKLAHLSTQGTHIVALRSGHLIQFDQPTLVVETIVKQLFPEKRDENSSSTPTPLTQELDGRRS